MPNCTGQQMLFGRLGRREIEANFAGGALSSDGGLLLVRQVDRRIGLSKAVAEALHNPRNPERITHELHDLVAQRLYGLCCGYEDLNDHGQLRQDPLMQTAVGTTAELSSSPTLSRLETRATRSDIVALNGVLVEQFIASHRVAPKELILDVDASDIPLHGDQEQAEFHAYYDHYCYLPLYVFAGQAMLACVLRRSRIDGAKPVSAVIKLLVTRLREAWPDVRRATIPTSWSPTSTCRHWRSRTIFTANGAKRRAGLRKPGSTSLAPVPAATDFWPTGYA